MDDEHKLEPELGRPWLIRFGCGALFFTIILLAEIFSNAEIPLPAYGVVAGLMGLDTLLEALRVWERTRP